MAVCRMKELEQEQPAVAMTTEDGADLRRCRRGIEPLRIVIMPQTDQRATTLPVIELLPVLVRCCRPDDGVRRAMQPQPAFPRSGLPDPERSALVDRRDDRPLASSTAHTADRRVRNSIQMAAGGRPEAADSRPVTLRMRQAVHRSLKVVTRLRRQHLTQGQARGLRR